MKGELGRALGWHRTEGHAGQQNTELEVRRGGAHHKAGTVAWFAPV